MVVGGGEGEGPLMSVCAFVAVTIVPTTYWNSFLKYFRNGVCVYYVEYTYSIPPPSLTLRGTISLPPEHLAMEIMSPLPQTCGCCCCCFYMPPWPYILLCMWSAWDFTWPWAHLVVCMALGLSCGLHGVLHGLGPILWSAWCGRHGLACSHACSMASPMLHAACVGVTEPPRQPVRIAPSCCPPTTMGTLFASECE